MSTDVFRHRVTRHPESATEAPGDVACDIPVAVVAAADGQQAEVVEGVITRVGWSGCCVRAAPFSSSAANRAGLFALILPTAGASFVARRGAPDRDATLHLVWGPLGDEARAALSALLELAGQPSVDRRSH